MRTLARVLAPSFLYGLVQGMNDGLRLFLRQDSGEALLPAVARNLDAGLLLRPAAWWAAIGVAVYALGASWLSRRSGSGRGASEAKRALASAYVVLLVPAGLGALCVVSLLVSPRFPYGSNLALTLALEGTFVDILTLGAFAGAAARALVSPGRRAEAHRGRLRVAPPILLVVAALAGFTWATPERFYEDGAGQGNMFKYLRMAKAAAGSGTLDIARADENPSPGVTDALAHVPAVLAAGARESLRLGSAIAGAAARGELYTGERTARRANRSMFRSEEGGIYYINAPGPGLLLVPAYLVDRALNRAFGWRRQLAVIVFWHLLGALVVLEMVRAGRPLAGVTASGLAALALAFTVPILFYTFQIYPELPGALLLLFAFRKLVLEASPTRAGIFAGALAIAALPWMHQKYSVTAALLGLYAAHRLARGSVSGVRRHATELALLFVPLAVSAYSVFLYNHALTGSLSPTATFASAGRSSFEPQSSFRGLLGLLLDRDNGLFVFAPLCLLALAGAGAFYRDVPRARLPFVLVVGSYLLVIGSFPYWPGAVSTMGRYISSILPLLSLPIAYVARRCFAQGRVLGAGLVLGAASFAFSVSFARDLIPSYQPELLWNRALYSDPAQYLPSFLSAGAIGSGPAHEVKLLACLALAAIAVALSSGRRLSGWRRSEEPARPSRFARDVAAGASALLLALIAVGAVVERWPGNAAGERGRPRGVLELSSGGELAVEGRYGFEQGGVWVPGGGTTRFELLSRVARRDVELRFTSGPEANTVRFAERGARDVTIPLPPGGPHSRRFRLRNPFRFSGPRGDRFLYRFEVHSRGGFVPSEEGRGGDERRLGVFVRLR